MTSKALFTLALPVFVSIALLSGCAGTPKGDSAAFAADVEPISGTSATLIVHGMSCPLCVSNVDKQLLTIPGVASVNVDLGSGEVDVSLAPNARVSKAQLAKAVYSSGFTLVEVRTP